MINLYDKKICITGGSGFLGTALVKNLIEKRTVPSENIFIPRSHDFDLRQWDPCRTIVKNQNIIIHLAANVGGIGYNQENPATLFYDNALMGLELMEAARQHGVEKFVCLGTVCAYPKYTPVPFKENDLWNGYPE